MTERDTELGEVKSIERVMADDGRVVMRAIVDFYDGNCPELTLETIWGAAPVKIIEVRVRGEKGDQK